MKAHTSFVALAFAVAAAGTPAFAQDAAGTQSTDAPARPPAAIVAKPAKAQAGTVPADPYPIVAAGWGSGSGHDFFGSRWVEDWRGLKAQGKAPPLKAMPLFGLDDVTLTLNGELRLRSNFYDNGQLMRGNDYHDLALRTVAGADLRIGDHFRIYGELGHASETGLGPYTVAFKGKTDSASYDNDISVQQLFAEARTFIGPDLLVGVQGGRFEFSDGPKPLISVSNGHSLHRTWNGFRTYLHTHRFRLDFFRGKTTMLDYGWFDETVNHGEQLTAVNASFKVLPFSKSSSLFIDPLYFHTYNLKDASGPGSGIGHRDTWGARVWGKQGALSFDWLGLRQTGDHLSQHVSAWMIALNQTYALSSTGWKPKIGLRIDVSSGGNSFSKTGVIHSYNPIYQSSSYLGEGHLLGDTNLVLISPTVAITPTGRLTVTAEYDLVERNNDHDAFYGSGVFAYKNTQNFRGHYIGTYGRLVGKYALTRNIGIEMEGDHLSAGHVLHEAGYGDGNYLLLGVDLRY